jgi:hypothetical protein
MNFRKAEFPIILFWSYIPNTISYLSHLPIFHCRFLFKYVEDNFYKMYAAPIEERTNKYETLSVYGKVNGFQKLEFRRG